MLVYVAALTMETPRPDFVMAGVAVREADERAMTSAAAEHVTGTALVEAALSGGWIAALTAVARDAELESVAPASRCADGLYTRLIVVLDAGLRPPGDWPSLFFSVRQEHLAKVRVGLEQAAIRSGQEKLTFIAAAAGASAGGRVADAIARVIAASYAGEPPSHAVSRHMHSDGRPSGWVHYTINNQCQCPGCRTARSAVAPPVRRAAHGPQPADVPIERLNLPIRVYNALRANRIRTVGQAEDLRDEELLRFRNIGRSHVALLRDAVERYRRDHPG